MAGLGNISDYLNQIGGADVGGGGLNLGSLLGQGGGLGGGIPGIGGIGDLLSGIGQLQQGGVGGDISGASNIAGGILSFIPGIGTVAGPALAAVGNLIGSLIPPGLAANIKPQMFANYLQGQGGLAGDLGQLINAAQSKAGSGSGVLSQAGAGAYNPNFDATLLEALTGQSLGTPDASGRITFTAPPSGGAKQPVSLSFLPESSLMSSPGMKGLSAYGYTPQQLSTPQAQKAIESATNYGMVGTGQGLGTQKVAQYLPKVVQALTAAGITPGAQGGGGGGGGGGGDTGKGGSTGSGDGQGSGGNLNLNDLLNLLKTIGGQGGGGGDGNTLTIPSLSQLLGLGGVNQQANPTMTQNANPTINIQAPKAQPWTQASTSFSPVTVPGFASRAQQMVPL